MEYHELRPLHTFDLMCECVVYEPIETSLFLTIIEQAAQQFDLRYRSLNVFCSMIRASARCGAWNFLNGTK